jgi:hypothetical protein
MVCGGCSNPDWKIMKTQRLFSVKQKTWEHPLGEIE